MNFAAALLYAVSTSALLAVALAFLRGGLDSATAAMALGGGLFVSSLALWQGRVPRERGRSPSLPEWLAIVVYILVFLRIFLWLVFIDGDDIKVLSPNNLGDFSLHLTYIRYLAGGVPFWPDNPIFTGGKLTYPVGVDLFQSLLTLLGANVFRGFIWLGLAGAALTGIALWSWGRSFALFGFLANGGLAGFAIFHSWQLADFQSDLAWKSFALALFATQRGLLFALPAGLLLLCSWRTRFFSAAGQSWQMPFAGELLLYASMPLFHFHTFLFLSVLLASWFIWNPPSRRGLGKLVAAACLPASALVYCITGGFRGGHLLGVKAGWMWDDASFLEWCRVHLGNNSLWTAGAVFWPLNFGILPILVALLAAVLCRRGEALWPRLVVFPAVAMFLVCCIIKFAPWEWDNTKLMVWSYVAILPFLWSELLAQWACWVRWPCVAALFFSGFISTLGGIDGSHTGFFVASRAELDGVADGLRGIAAAERFAGAPTYNHPLLLNGRKMVLGYLGHVHSHGLDWQAPSAKLDALMIGDPQWQQLAKELGARYLFWGRNEEDQYKESTQPWKKSSRFVAGGEWGAIYDLRQPPESPPGLPAMHE